MTWTRHTLAAVFLALAAAAPASAGAFPSFRAVTEAPGRVALDHGGTTVLRWRSRPGEAGAQTLARAAERLNALAWAGLSPADFTVSTAVSASSDARSRSRRRGPAGRDALLQVKDETLLRVDHAHAALSGGTPEGIARVWARNLGRSFAKPYVLAPPSPPRVPVGETRTAAIGGRPGPGLALRNEEPSVAAGQLSADGQGVLLRGLGSGTARFVLSAGGFDAAVTADVRPWAVTVAGPVRARVTGRGALAEWAPSCVAAAIWQRLAPSPGAEAGLSQLRLGATSAQALLEASAPGCFAVRRQVQVAIERELLPVLTSERTVLSNEPERVSVPATLARTGLAQGQPTTLLWHHVATGTRELAVRVSLVNTGGTTARVHVLGADGGPSDDEVYAGHVAMQRFISASTEGTGCVFTVPGGSRVEVCRLAMPVGQVVSGLAQLRALEGDAVAAEVQAVTPGTPEALWEPLEAALPPAAGPSLELAGAKQVTVRHEVGKAWQFVRIGKAPEDATLHPRLRGDYGVQHDIEVVFLNPQGADARLEIGLRGGGGTARAVVQVDGRVVETGLLSSGVEELLYRQRSREPEVRVRLRMMPQSGSNYPLTVTARSFEQR